MITFPFILIAIPIILRHSHHFWCIRGAPRTVQKKGLLSVAIWFISYISLLVGIVWCIFRLQYQDLTWYFYTGYAILWLAVIGRMVSIQQLGKEFSEFIHIRDQHKLIDSGIFAYIRHPLHYFLLLEIIAMAWLVNKFWGWGIVVGAFITLIFREIQEEKALLEAFGEKYRTYRKKAKALVDLLSSE